MAGYAGDATVTVQLRLTVTPGVRKVIPFCCVTLQRAERAGARATTAYVSHRQRRLNLLAPLPYLPPSITVTVTGSVYILCRYVVCTCLVPDGSRYYGLVIYLPTLPRTTLYSIRGTDGGSVYLLPRFPVFARSVHHLPLFATGSAPQVPVTCPALILHATTAVGCSCGRLPHITPLLRGFMCAGAYRPAYVPVLIATLHLVLRSTTVTVVERLDYCWVLSHYLRVLTRYVTW